MWEHSDFWGGHATANTNVTLDVREGAVYHHGGGHGVVGPVELTGGTFKSTSGPSQWADAAFCGGITAHAAATPSRVLVGYKGFVGHRKRHVARHGHRARAERIRRADHGKLSCNLNKALFSKVTFK